MRKGNHSSIGYLAYVGVMTKMVGLAGCFCGCFVASDFLICS